MQFKFEWDDREVRKMFEEYPGKFTWEHIEEEVRKLRMRGVSLESML